MSELGSGSGSGYPAALDTNNTLEVNSPNAGKTKVRADVPNDLAAAVVAIQTELGIDPAGSLTDVKTNLQTEHGADGTHDNTKVVMLAGAQTVTGDKTVSGATTVSGVMTFSAAPVLQGAAWPSFSAHNNDVAQSVANATWVKAEFDTEEFDTNSDYDATTNFRFTPTAAGKYLLIASGHIDVNDADTTEVAIYKNGTSSKENSSSAGSNGEGGPIVTSVFDANGTTDYFEVFVKHNFGANANLSNAKESSFFSGCRIG